MIRILTTCFKAKDYIEMTINSLKLQEVKEWKCYITDDLSNDGTVDFVKKIIEGDERFELIENTKKMYQPGNYWQILQKDEIDDNDICITLDGDDWLSDKSVLNRVINYYSNDNTLVTCGQFVHYHAPKTYSEGFSYKPEPFEKLRELRWTSTHLRTFKALLFRKIKKEDLLSPTGEFWDTCGDLAFMCPMLEMAGEDRVTYVNDINMIYNVETPLNDFKIDVKKQHQYAGLIRAKNKYERLDNV